jgi:DNA polymerase elongation subunit (family B)
MNTYVYFDIETIPAQGPEALEAAKKSVAPPKTLKNEASIKQWWELKSEAAAKEALAKTSFDGGRGHVCTIAWAKDDSPIDVSHADTVEGEREVISAFFSALDPFHSETLVGHNITGFDLGFLRKRAVVLGIPMPARTVFPRDPKPWDRNVEDTMTMWAGGTGKISMDNLCNILGIDGKDGFDGSQVAEAWANGEHAKIAEYCQDDVARTREIHKRFIAAGW